MKKISYTINDYCNVFYFLFKFTHVVLEDIVSKFDMLNNWMRLFDVLNCWISDITKDVRIFFCCLTSNIHMRMTVYKGKYLTINEQRLSCLYYKITAYKNLKNKFMLTYLFICNYTHDWHRLSVTNFIFQLCINCIKYLSMK